MTDQRRSRPPSPARRRTPSPAVSDNAVIVDDREVSLGEVSFDEWFETPVFESDADERLEELATSQRGPLRLAARTLLRLNARTARPPAAPTPTAIDVEPETVVDLTPAAPEEADAPVLRAHTRRSGGAHPSLRDRLSAALDRWAEQEAVTQERLERLILPRRWHP